VSLRELHQADERVREELADVRAKLEKAVAALERVAVAKDAARARGVYRKVPATDAAESEAHAEDRERLRASEAWLIEELERLRVELERAGAPRDPVLDATLTTPCRERWNEMDGDGDARTCARCKATVVNIAMVDSERATQLVTMLGGTAHLHRRTDGTLVAQNCARGAARGRAPRFLLSVGALAAAVALAVWATRPSSSAVPRLGDATWLHVHDKYDTVGMSWEVDIDFTRRGDRFDATVACEQSSVSKEVPAFVVERFLDAVSGKEPRGPEGVCYATDDYPKIEVTLREPRPLVLAVRNCSRQWLFDGHPLGDVSRTVRLEQQYWQDEINAAYLDMVEMAGIGRCKKG
jgi:hypothetical protein